ncbi:hypothetical protein [Lutibacter citreus]|uniref:hypothetical protein n=1 Tax=Lutibacter citreus TaxID=2138210 RepID=UPI000DBE8E8B|nr:hypothetical protein [Lutibacter citreus]
MESRTDFILREIEQLGLFLKKLIQEVNEVDSNEAEDTINKTSEVLKAQFQISISEIIELNKNELTHKINNLHESHIEKFAELINEIVKKLSIIGKSEYKFNKKELASKAIFLIEYLDSKSDTFSISRMNLKKKLQQNL